MVEEILELISMFLALIIVLPLHEFAHAFAAVKSGDMTPKLYKRYTLNPLAHFDPIGLICFLFARFGWAKPVPVNSNNFRHYKRGCFFVSIAGVTANYLTAFIIYPIIILSLTYLPTFGYFTLVINNALIYIYSFSLSFMVFNLIPVYPLDGFRVLDVFAKKRSKIYWFLRTKGVYILYALFILGIIARYVDVPQLNVLGIGINYVVNVISKPITLFWGLIF